jgi:hypothetical protein
MWTSGNRVQGAFWGSHSNKLSGRGDSECFATHPKPSRLRVQLGPCTRHQGDTSPSQLAHGPTIVRCESPRQLSSELAKVTPSRRLLLGSSTPFFASVFVSTPSPHLLSPRTLASSQRASCPVSHAGAVSVPPECAPYVTIKYRAREEHSPHSQSTTASTRRRTHASALRDSF